MSTENKQTETDTVAADILGLWRHFTALRNPELPPWTEPDEDENKEE